MTNYSKAWQKFRRINRLGYSSLALFFILAILIFVASDLLANFIGLILTMILLSFISFTVNLMRIKYFRCPRCGEFFYKISPFGTAGLKNHCVFCNLKLYENPKS